MARQVLRERGLNPLGVEEVASQERRRAGTVGLADQRDRSGADYPADGDAGRFRFAAGRSAGRGGPAGRAGTIERFDCWRCAPGYWKGIRWRPRWAIFRRYSRSCTGRRWPPASSPAIWKWCSSGWPITPRPASRCARKSGWRCSIRLLLTGVAILIVAGLLTYVVPQVVQVFSSLNQQLPALTRGLIALSDFLRQYGWLLLLASGGGRGSLGYALRRIGFRRRVHRVLLRLPLLAR
jgi:general secretion pathway protein F